MTGLVILTFIPFIVAIGFFIRARGERNARQRAEAHVDVLAREIATAAADHTEWNAMLSHELRSPAAAILGYQELIEDGAFGAPPEAMRDALQRIRFAADQLVSLLDAVERRAYDGVPHDPPRHVSAVDLIADAMHTLRFEAEGRGTRITCAAGDVRLVTRPDEARHALIIALGAIIKSSPGRAIHIDARDGADPDIVIAGMDHPRTPPDQPLSGYSLRLQLAAACARAAGGSLVTAADGSLHLLLPRLTAPGAAPSPD